MARKGGGRTGPVGRPYLLEKGDQFALEPFLRRGRARGACRVEEESSAARGLTWPYQFGDTRFIVSAKGLATGAAEQVFQGFQDR